MITLYSHMPFN